MVFQILQFLYQSIKKNANDIQWDILEFWPRGTRTLLKSLRKDIATYSGTLELLRSNFKPIREKLKER